MASMACSTDKSIFLHYSLEGPLIESEIMQLQANVSCPRFFATANFQCFGKSLALVLDVPRYMILHSLTYTSKFPRIRNGHIRNWRLSYLP